MNFANAGIPVTVVEMAQEALDRGLGVVRKNYEATAARGRLTHGRRREAHGPDPGTTDFGRGAPTPTSSIEAVFEEMPIKKEVFAKLDGICQAGRGAGHQHLHARRRRDRLGDQAAGERDRHALLQPGQRHAAARERARREVVEDDDRHGDGASGRRIGKVPVLVGVCYGFVGNRMLHQRGQRGREAHPGGRAAPPGRQGAHRLRLPDGAVRHGRPGRPRRGLAHPQGPRREVAGGRPHLRAGALRPEDGRRLLHATRRATARRSPTPRSRRSSSTCRREQGITRRPISDEEILQRLLYPMVNEGAKILEEKIAIRASDIDVIWVYGYGWPVYRGGPMFWADSDRAHGRARPDARVPEGQRRRFWTPGAAARPARQRGQDVHGSVSAMRALVTGAASGIGRATCLRLARDAQTAGRKAQIAAVDLGPSPALDALGRELATWGRRCCRSRATWPPRTRPRAWWRRRSRASAGSMGW